MQAYIAYINKESRGGLRVRTVITIIRQQAVHICRSNMQGHHMYQCIIPPCLSLFSATCHFEAKSRGIYQRPPHKWNYVLTKKIRH